MNWCLITCPLGEALVPGLIAERWRLRSVAFVLETYLFINLSMFIHLSIYLSICIYLSIRLSIYLSIYIQTWHFSPGEALVPARARGVPTPPPPSARVENISIYLFNYLSSYIWLFIYLSFYLSIYIYPSIFLSIYPHIAPASPFNDSVTLWPLRISLQGVLTLSCVDVLECHPRYDGVPASQMMRQEAVRIVSLTKNTTFTGMQDSSLLSWERI